MCVCIHLRYKFCLNFFRMDYEANRLSSGLLQLSNNTHLVVDETRLEAGKLDAAGKFYKSLFSFEYHLLHKKVSD